MLNDPNKSKTSQMNTPARPRWFLSYTSQDLRLAQELAVALRRADMGAEIFFAPESMRAGHFWVHQLADEIAQSTAFVLLVGETGVGPWQVMEYYEALDRRAKEQHYPIILIVSPKRAAPGLPFARQLHWVFTDDPASEDTLGKLKKAMSGASGKEGELWRFTRPYRGLEAMTEANSDYFFARGQKTADVIDALASARDKIPILLGNSGVGKSSLAQAGVLGCLLRQGWSDAINSSNLWPAALHDSRRWCFLKLRPGPRPLKTLVQIFLDIWQYQPASARRVREEKEWIELLLQPKTNLSDLLDATERQYEQDLKQTPPPTYLLYIDQGEELYHARADERERRRFSELIAGGLRDNRFRAFMSLRADFTGELHKDEALFRVRHQIDVPPLRQDELYEIVTRPAELLSVQFETDHLAEDIAKRAAEDSVKDTGALPLLSYLLDDMWSQMVNRRNPDGVLRLSAPAIDLGRVLSDHGDKFLADNRASEDPLRRIFIKLATVRADGEPIRRRASRSEFTEEEWRLVCELVDYPNRLLVTASAGTETYAEVAHEAIFRRWAKVREWIEAEREFLAWRNGLEAARREWEKAPDRFKKDALLMGFALAKAQDWLTSRQADLSGAEKQFIALSRKAAQRRRARARALVGVLAVAGVGSLIGWFNHAYLEAQWREWTVTDPYMRAQIRPYLLTAIAEQSLKPGESFKECATDCPEMIVLPAGSFTMGSPATNEGNFLAEQHPVTIPRPFAVSKYEVTFADWDACARYGDCEPDITDSNFGRGRQPVINVTWYHAQQYVGWLSRMTGKIYRLLSEAEYEYATRAQTQTVYPWGNEVRSNNANCIGCGSQWDGRQPAPVGSFAPNPFGLYDMVGNIWKWLQDCEHSNYKNAPKDGSAWIEQGECKFRMVRGGSWANHPAQLRSAFRNSDSDTFRNSRLGFRIARTLAAP
jgi:formylglycine-generating enzyme required for sulfatase activity